MTVWVFKLRSFSCLRTKSAESRSLKGSTIRTVGFSFGADIGCGSSTLEATNDLTVELIRSCGYFSLANIALKRSHSSRKYDQHDDKRYARSVAPTSRKNITRKFIFLSFSYGIKSQGHSSGKIFGQEVLRKVTKRENYSTS